MNRREFLFNTFAAAGIAAGVSAMTSATSRDALRLSDKTASDADRLLDARGIRCSYITYAPFIMKDPNTGVLSGLFYDLTQKLGEIADIKITWVEETSFATFTEDLRRSKYDLFAGGLWPEAKQAKAINYSLPAFYSGLSVYVRKNDRRFDGNVAKLNDPAYRLATIDGEMSLLVQRSDFPSASVLSLPDTADISMLAESVATGKADATVIEKAVANLYLAKNPGALRALDEAKPIRVFENTWAFDYSHPRLKNVIDTAIREMLYSGYIDKVLAQYEPLPGSFYRAQTSYK